MTTVNGVHVGIGFVVLLAVLVFGAGLGSWRDEMKRIREANKPIVPPIDYEQLHYGPALKAFLDKQGASK